MSKGLRLTLWVLSSLAVLWTILTVIGLAAMGPMHAGMMGDQPSGGMMGGSMRNGMMTGMVLHMALTPIVLLGLDGVFIYLIATSRRPTEGETAARERRAA